MTKIVKNYFLDKLLVNRFFLSKQRNAITNYIKQLNESKKILIILPIIRQYDHYINEFKTNLTEVFKNCSISTFDITSLRKNDMNWLGVPNKEYLNHIREENFDLLIDLNEKQDRICTYLSALSDAPLRIHFSEGKFDKLYNLQIRTAVDANFPTKVKTLFNYLAKFSPAENVMF